MRRYPLFDCAKVEYERRVDGLGVLGAYTNGANEAGAELKPLVPSLMSIPTGEWDEFRESTTLSAAKATRPARRAPCARRVLAHPRLGPRQVMRWPMGVPVLGDAAPPAPESRIQGEASLESVPSCVVGVRSFSDPTTEPIVREQVRPPRRAATPRANPLGAFPQVRLLRQALRRDGLAPGGSEAEEFRLAQFDALNSLNARRSEVWVALDEHPW